MPPEQFWLMLAQTIATAILGIGAISVAIVSAVIAYRNNFGWEPAIARTRVVTGSGPEGRRHIGIEFQIWNRRKYPIIVYTADVAFLGIGSEGQLETIVLDKSERYEVEPEDTETEYVRADLRLFLRKLMESNQHAKYYAQVYHRVDQRPKNARVKIRYHDQRNNKTIVIEEIFSLAFNFT